MTDIFTRIKNSRLAFDRSKYEWGKAYWTNVINRLKRSAKNG